MLLISLGILTYLHDVGLLWFTLVLRVEASAYDVPLVT